MNNTGNETIKLLPNFVTVKYLVSMKDYENVNESSFKAIVNYDQIKNKEKNLLVDIIRTPSDVKITKTDPSTISYLIYK